MQATMEKGTTREEFHDLVAGIASRIHGRALDAQLQDWLNEHVGEGSAEYAALRAACARDPLINPR